MEISSLYEVEGKASPLMDVIRQFVLLGTNFSKSSEDDIEAETIPLGPKPMEDPPKHHDVGIETIEAHTPAKKSIARPQSPPATNRGRLSLDTSARSKNVSDIDTDAQTRSFARNDIEPKPSQRKHQIDEVVEARGPTNDVSDRRAASESTRDEIHQHFDEMEQKMEEHFYRQEKIWNQISFLMENVQREVDRNRLKSAQPDASKIKSSVLPPRDASPGEKELTAASKNEAPSLSPHGTFPSKKEVTVDSESTSSPVLSPRQTAHTENDLMSALKNKSPLPSPRETDPAEKELNEEATSMQKVLSVTSSTSQELDGSIQSSFPQLRAYVSQLESTSASALAKVLVDEEGDLLDMDEAPSDETTDAPDDEILASAKSNNILAPSKSNDILASSKSNDILVSSRSNESNHPMSFACYETNDSMEDENSMHEDNMPSKEWKKEAKYMVCAFYESFPGNQSEHSTTAYEAIDDDVRDEAPNIEGAGVQVRDISVTSPSPGVTELHPPDDLDSKWKVRVAHTVPTAHNGEDFSTISFAQQISSFFGGEKTSLENACTPFARCVKWM